MNSKGQFSCFGEYGSQVRCRTCFNSTTCKAFTKEKQTVIYRKLKSKKRGKKKVYIS